MNRKPRHIVLGLLLSLIVSSTVLGSWPDFKVKTRTTVKWPDFKVSKTTIVKEEPADQSCPNGQCGTVSRQGIFFRWRSR